MTQRQRRAQEAARAARALIGLGDLAPVADVCAAIEEGPDPVPVLVQPLPKSVAGIYLHRDDVTMIVVNSSQAPVRQRFTLAHEFGHHRMHKETVLDTPADIAGQTTKGIEIEANYFAAELLAPLEAVDRWMRDHDEPAIDIEVLVRMWCHFGASVQTMRYRLEEAGYLKAREIRELDVLIERKEHHGMPRRLGLHELKDGYLPAVTKPPAETQRKLIHTYEAGALEIERVAALLGADPDELSNELAAEGVTPIQPADPLDDPLFAD